ncbi:hypothetical protein IAT40_000144 [Kwoniella sp. CBS 6097]
MPTMPRKPRYKSANTSTPRPPRNDSYPSKSSPFELLPLELKLRIASHLYVSGSKDELHALARSCGAWQGAAESLIWRKVDISLPQEWEQHPTLQPPIYVEGCAVPEGDLCKSHLLDWRDGNVVISKHKAVEDYVADIKSTARNTSAAVHSMNFNFNRTSWCVRDAKLRTRISQVQQAIDNRPDRLSHIQEITVESPHAPLKLYTSSVLGSFDDWASDYHQQTWDTLIQLLKELGPRLKTFQLDPFLSDEGRLRLQSVAGTREEFDPAWHRSRLLEKAFPFPSLRALDRPWPSWRGIQHALTHALKSFQSVDISHLVLNPPWPASVEAPLDPAVIHLMMSAQTGSAAGTEDISKVKPDPILSRLRSLAFRRLDASGLRNIASLFECLVDLESIHLDLHFGHFHHALIMMVNEKLLGSLSDLKSLRRITWFGGMEARWLFEKISDRGFENVKVLVQSQAIECESETYIDNIYIPPFPSLKYIQVPCRSPKWHRHTKPPEWAKAPPPRNSISSPIIQHLREAPNLLGVQFGIVQPLDSSPGFGFGCPLKPEDDNGEILDSDGWYDQRVNGVLIRSYLNPVTGDEMYHFRRMELLKIDIKFYQPVSSRNSVTTSPTARTSTQSASSTSTSPSRSKANNKSPKKTKGDERENEDYRWVDHTSFKGVAVPLPILKKIYRLKGEKNAEWKIPGRGLELPNEAWEVVHKWRRSLPDKGEVGLEGERRIVTRSMGVDSGSGTNA